MNSKDHMDNSRFISTNRQNDESLTESIRKIKNSVAKEKQFRLSPSNNKRGYKPTVLVSKDLKIIENNIIFLPNNFLASKDHDRKIEKSLPHKKKRIFFLNFKNSFNFLKIFL